MILFVIAGLVLFGGFACRWPTAGLAAALSSLALGFYWFLPEQLPGLPDGLLLAGHKAVVAVALAANAVWYGFRLSVRSWPLAVTVLLVLQSVLVADAREIDAAQIGLAAFGLALPWLFVQVGLEPGSRRVYAHVLALTPAFAVASGAALHFLGVYPLFDGHRLQGATNAGWLSFAAFAGFAVCLHEAWRSSRRRFAYLAAMNFAIAIFTLGRMGVFACLLFALIYAAAASDFRDRIGRLGAALAIGAGIVIGVFVSYLPFLEARMFEGGNELLNMSGRDEIWSGYLRQFLDSPLLGHGLGAASQLTDYFDLPHNEYLRLLVEGGLLGCGLFLAAVVLWGRQLLARVDAGGRAFLTAAFSSLAVYAITDNVLLMPPALLLFAYFGVILERPRRVRSRRTRARRHRDEDPSSVGGREPVSWETEPGGRLNANR